MPVAGSPIVIAPHRAKQHAPSPPSETLAAAPSLQTQQSLELWGLGPATHAHPLSYPRAADMAVIRPSAAPYLPGMFIQFVLPPAAMARLQPAPLLAALLPTARWVGGAASSWEAV